MIAESERVDAHREECAKISIVKWSVKETIPGEKRTLVVAVRPRKTGPLGLDCIEFYDDVHKRHFPMGLGANCLAYPLPVVKAQSEVVLERDLPAGPPIRAVALRFCSQPYMCRSYYVGDPANRNEVDQVSCDRLDPR
jgi:hypothetical protein